jgi:NAD-dependent deacetylase
VKFVFKIKTNEKKLVVLTGGNKCRKWIKTFRDSDGLWEGHNVQDVATPEGWSNNPALVLDFYNQRRQLSRSTPNLAHQILELEAQFDVL